MQADFPDSNSDAIRGTGTVDMHLEIVTDPLWNSEKNLIVPLLKTSVYI